MFSTLLFGEQHRVSGSIVNTKGEVVVGAKIRILSPGTEATSITNATGNFSLLAPEGDFLLQVTGKNLVEKEVKISAARPTHDIVITVDYAIPTARQSIIITASAITPEIDRRNSAIYDNTLFTSR